MGAFCVKSYLYLSLKKEHPITIILSWCNHFISYLSIVMAAEYITHLRDWSIPILTCWDVKQNRWNILHINLPNNCISYLWYIEIIKACPYGVILQTSCPIGNTCLNHAMEEFCTLRFWHKTTKVWVGSVNSYICLDTNPDSSEYLHCIEQFAPLQIIWHFVNMWIASMIDRTSLEKELLSIKTYQTSTIA